MSAEWKHIVLNLKLAEGEQSNIPEDIHFTKLKQQLSLEAQFPVGRHFSSTCTKAIPALLCSGKEGREGSKTVSALVNFEKSKKPAEEICLYDPTHIKARGWSFKIGVESA